MKEKTDHSPDENLQALADWLDRAALTGLAEAVRDWMPDRDGPWRPFAASLAGRLGSAGGTRPEALRSARRLLLSPKSRLGELVKDPHHAIGRN